MYMPPDVATTMHLSISTRSNIPFDCSNDSDYRQDNRVHQTFLCLCSFSSSMSTDSKIDMLWALGPIIPLQVASETPDSVAVIL